MTPADRHILGRAPLVLAALLLAALVVGLAAFGGRADAGGAAPHPSGVRARSGCAEHALRFLVSDDPADVAAQDAFERSGDPVPAPGIHRRVLPRTPLLHAVEHGYIAVLHRAGALTPEAHDALAGLVARASAKNLSVLVAPARQEAPLVAIRTGMRLTCRGGDLAQAQAVRRFAAAQLTALR